jgi:hypothetical protein
MLREMETHIRSASQRYDSRSDAGDETCAMQLRLALIHYFLSDPESSRATGDAFEGIYTFGKKAHWVQPVKLKIAMT